jgi:hypothetical protein
VEIYIKSSSTGGEGDSPSSALPLMNGTAAAGSATRYSREDHVHPTAGTNNTQIADFANLESVGTLTDVLPVPVTDVQMKCGFYFDHDRCRVPGHHQRRGPRFRGGASLGQRPGPGSPLQRFTVVYSDPHRQ